MAGTGGNRQGVPAKRINQNWQNTKRLNQMKKIKADDKRTAVHIVNKTLLQPYNPVTINLIGAGGTGGQVLTALARMNHALIALDHPGLMVRLWDDDKV